MGADSQQSSNDREAPASSGDARLQHLTLGLLVVIIVALAGLWIVERGKSRRAREDLLEMQRAVSQQNDQIRAVLGLEPPAALDRDHLPRRAATIDDQPREVLLLKADQARTLGLQDGDVVEVAPVEK
jgi:hypothetical protein